MTLAEAVNGQAGDVEGRFFTKDSFGHDLPYGWAVLEPMAAEADSSSVFPVTWI